MCTSSIFERLTVSGHSMNINEKTPWRRCLNDEWYAVCRGSTCAVTCCLYPSVWIDIFYFEAITFAIVCSCLFPCFCSLSVSHSWLHSYGWYFVVCLCADVGMCLRERGRKNVNLRCGVVVGLHLLLLRVVYISDNVQPTKSLKPCFDRTSKPVEWRHWWTGETRTSNVYNCLKQPLLWRLTINF